MTAAPDQRLSRQLRTVGEQIAGMAIAGEFDALPDDTCASIVALGTYLQVAASYHAATLEDICGDRLPVPLENMRPIADVIEEAVRRVEARRGTLGKTP